jgi:hypothetical protein
MINIIDSKSDPINKKNIFTCPKYHFFSIYNFSEERFWNGIFNKFCKWLCSSTSYECRLHR